jgi:hypothetical protein
VLKIFISPDLYRPSLPCKKGIFTVLKIFISRDLYHPSPSSYTSILLQKRHFYSAENLYLTWSLPSFPFFLSLGRFFLKNRQIHQTTSPMATAIKTKVKRLLLKIANFDFYVGFFCRNTVHVWWAQINVSDPCQVVSSSFLNRSGSLKELWNFALWTFSLAVGVVAKSAGSENPDCVHLRNRYSIGRSLKTAEFQTGKCLRKP